MTLLLAAVLFALLVWIPGGCLAHAAGLRGWGALAVAPGITAMLVALTAMGLPLLGLRWTTAALPALALLTAVLALALVAVTRRFRAAARPPGRDAPRDGAGGGAGSSGGALERARTALVRAGRGARETLPVIAAVALCAGACLCSYLWGAVHDRWPAQAFDATFHLSAVAAIREEGDASLLGGLRTLYQGADLYYPSVWHALVTLLPGSVPVATNGALLGLGGLVWPVSLAGMLLGLRSDLPAGPRTGVWAVALSLLVGGSAAAFTVLTTALTVWPYALSVTALPGCLLLAHLLLPPSRRGLSSGGRTTGAGGGSGDGAASRAGAAVQGGVPSASSGSADADTRGGAPEVLPGPGATVFLLALAAGGLVAAHGTGAFNLLVLGLAWIPRLWRAVGRWSVRLRSVGLVLVLLMMAGGLWVLRRPLASVMGYLREDGGWAGLAATAGQALADLPMYGRVWSPTSLLGILMAALTLAGAWAIRAHPRLRTWGAMWGTALLLIICVGGPSWWGRQLGAPWYLQKSRLAPLVLVPALALICLAWARLLERRGAGGRREPQQDAAEQAVLRRSGPWRSVPLPSAPRRALAAGLIALLLVVGRLPLQRDLVASVHDPDQVRYGTLVAREEFGFFARTADLLPQDAVVLGAPSRGASHLWALEGVHVVYPVRSAPMPDSTQDRLLAAWPKAVAPDGGGVAQACPLLEELGAEYLYTDASPDAGGSHVGQPPLRWDGALTVLPDQGVELVHREGDYALWRITACQ
ncbi:DUF6541 family protein [Actinomyces bowdenii]|uniref:Beta-carotene 15,15'-monooxygenase n=1 Tax=Actinomyces bowdenii TaxID=131109 RepID=A0A853EJV0_9ACTO|nr:DUF6541 family protein [Actinomyces bowdenii]MBF0696862.1 hypothetical protein [Actinomyces bowdenii]NYS69035.1 hypothetical protein [Actinomyces bowdenii]